ncbi:type II toxin-antitoxin system RelE/ParE family toxin [Cereibacter sp. SYSU M97828]|nr:type II toxin-antitoxin system RelE/ParE family toxin [Cereibacter flavus]
MVTEQIYYLTPAAEQDLMEIWRYTVRQWSVEQAETYQDSLVDAFEGLAAGQKQGRPVAIRRRGYLSYAVGAHVVYFRNTEGGIIVVRVLHGRQDVQRHF